jgi:putative membrane protein
MFAIRTLLISGLFLLVAPLAMADDKRAADNTPFDDTTFITKAANCIQRDIEISKLAVTHARNEDVKKFAQKVVDDATTAEGELKKVATSASVQWPPKLDDESQKKLDTFKDYKGTNFDSDYMKCVIEHHEMAVKQLTWASKEAKNSELRNFATKELPEVEKCVERAKEIQNKIK